jgi:hypothetical protein
MFGAMRKTHERRPTPTERMSASMSAGWSRRGVRRRTSRSSPAMSTGYTAT